MIVLAAPEELMELIESVKRPPRSPQASPRSPSENFDLLVDPYYI